MGGAEIIVMLAAGLVAFILLVVFVSLVATSVLRATGVVLGHLGRFIAGMVGDAARATGSILTALVYVPLTVANLLIGRFSASAHYGRALLDELTGAGLALYRVVVHHPLTLVGLGRVVEGLERRVPEVMAHAPTAEMSPGRAGQFEGYRIVGTLPSGGSGAKLYVAHPDPIKLASLHRQGFTGVDQVVIKAFSTSEGSTLPQIVRESRSLDAAKKMGLILDHELTESRFFYAMRFVPGESLSLAARSMHAQCPPDGFDAPTVRRALGYAADLLSTLEQYHAGGLWHKDVKPDNIIVDERTGKATLVDFGLLSSLRSAMTLTTHGTEYFRDPQLVKLALKGVKVHEVDGTRFDIYAAGAVLFAMFEDSFPAHGVLSQVTKRCPDAVKWIIRRAMTDYDRRYPSAVAMLDDVRAVRDAEDPFAVRPADLPSVRGEPADASANATPESTGESQGPAMAGAQEAGQSQGTVAATGAQASADASREPGSPTGAAAQDSNPPEREDVRARIRLGNWFTGEARLIREDHRKDRGAVKRGTPEPRSEPRRTSVASQPTLIPRDQRASAPEQLRRARERAHDRRTRARARADGAVRVPRHRRHDAGINAGVTVAVALTVLGGIAAWRLASPGPSVVAMDDGTAPTPPMPPEPPSLQLPISRAASVTTIPAGESLSQDATAYIVMDVPQPWSLETIQQVSARLNGLLRAGFGTMGHYPQITGGTVVWPAADDSVEYLASLRLALGGVPMDSSGAAWIASTWLEDTGIDADFIVWISRGVDGRVVGNVLPGPEVDAEVVRAAESALRE